jgi:hypothetical protein
VRRGDHGGQSPHPTMRAKKQFSKTAVFVFAVWVFAVIFLKRKIGFFLLQQKNE